MDIPVNGHQIFTYTAASGTQAQGTLLFLHGAGHDHSVWTLPCRHFARLGFRILAPDLPGHGRSEGPPLASVEALADWAAQLLAACGAGPAIAIGHSMGSLVALCLAARHPQRVVRIALLGTALPMPVSDALRSAALHDEPRARSMINTWSFSPRGQIGSSGMPGQWTTGVNCRLMERTAPGVLHTDLSACNAFDGGDAVAAAVQCPALIIAGGRDQMTPPKAAHALALRLRLARLETITEAGHGMLAERPNQVLDALRSFILHA